MMANDLDELFRRQPPYSEDEVNKIIAHMREARARYLAGEKNSKEKPTMVNKPGLQALGLAKPKASVPKGSLDL